MNLCNDKTNMALKEAAEGDQEAFRYLYEAYYQYAFTIATKVISDYGVCEDIVQEAFLRCFRKIQGGEVISAFGGYLSRSVRNVAIDYIQALSAKKRPQEVYMPNNPSDEDEYTMEIVDQEKSEVQKALLRLSSFYQTPEEIVEGKEHQKMVRAVLDELPDYQKDVLIMYHIGNMRLKEIADVYGVSENTIKSRVRQGSEKIRKKYERLNAIQL